MNEGSYTRMIRLFPWPSGGVHERVRCPACGRSVGVHADRVVTHGFRRRGRQGGLPDPKPIPCITTGLRFAEVVALGGEDPRLLGARREAA
jgi:hypothetical protein